ncbi:MAG: hypothetical protein IJH39_01805 [Clostridia bacterium]|nr:hypothetical protein [Clostridia bacterium]
MKEYDKIEETLNKKCNKDVVSSYIQAMASIVLADSIIGRYFFDTDLQSSIEMGLKILETLPREDETSDVKRAYEIICSWLIENDLKFDRHEIKGKYNSSEDKREDYEILTERKEGDTSEKYGLYEDGYYYILPNKFQELLQKNELSAVAVKKQLAELNYIKIQRDKNRIYYEVLKFYNGGRRRMVAFKLENNLTLPQDEIEKLDQKDILYPNIGDETFEDI